MRKRGEMREKRNDITKKKMRKDERKGEGRENCRREDEKVKRKSLDKWMLKLSKEW